MTYQFRHRFASGVILHVFAHFSAGQWDFMDAWTGAGKADAEELKFLAGWLMAMFPEPAPGCAAFEAAEWLAKKYLHHATA